MIRMGTLGCLLNPELYPLVQRDTRTAGYPRPLGSPTGGGGGGAVSPAGTSDLGAVDDKTMHGVVMKLSMDWIYYKFQANNRTPQWVILKILCCVFKGLALIFIYCGQIIILGITKYWK